MLRMRPRQGVSDGGASDAVSTRCASRAHGSANASTPGWRCCRVPPSERTYRRISQVGCGSYFLAALLLVIVLNTSLVSGQPSNRSCAETGGGLLLRRLAVASEEACTSQGTLLQSQGRGGEESHCKALAQRRCCRSSDCQTGFVCSCHKECGIQTCHLSPLQTSRNVVLVSGQSSKRSCAETGGGVLLQRLAVAGEEACTAQGRLLQSQGRGGEETYCQALAQRRCCRSSDCQAGYVCACHGECGIRTCHLDPLQTSQSSCSPLLPPINGALTVTVDTPTVVAVTCHFGYRLSSAKAHLLCDAGTWSGDVPRCLKKCPIPRLPENSRIKAQSLPGLTFSQGEKLKISCEHGYSMRSRDGARFKEVRFVQCLETGEWKYLSQLQCSLRFATAPPPSCCSLPPFPQHGLRHGQRMRNGRPEFCLGDVVRFSCNSCYRPVGNSKFSCVNTRSQPQPNFRCEPVTCPQPRLLSGFSILDGPARNLYSCGMELSVGCDVTRDESRVTLTCGGNGTWSGLDRLRSYMCGSVAGPRKVKTRSRKSTSVSLKWRPPLYYPTDVSWYEVFAQSTRTGRRTTRDYVRDFDSNATRKAISFTYHALQPNTQYHFYIRAVYATLWYSQASDILLVTTAQAVISPPRNVEIQLDVNSAGASLTALATRLHWQEPATIPAQYSASDIEYEVRYRMTSAPVDLGYAQVGLGYVQANNHTTNGTEIILTDLQPYVSYTFTVTSKTPTSRSTPVSIVYTPKSATLRPRAPPAPQVRREGNILVINVLASPDVAPFVWRYLIRAFCDERESVNSLEDNGTPGQVQCPRQGRVLLSRFDAQVIDSAPRREHEVRVNLAAFGTQLVSGQRYRVQTFARSSSGATSGSLDPVYFTR